MSAATGGTGVRDKMFRKVLKGAVENQYKSSEAVSRVAALEGGTYTVQELEPITHSLSGPSLRRVQIEFPNHQLQGGGKGSSYRDVLELVPKELIPQVLMLAVEEEALDNGMEPAIEDGIGLNEFLPSEGAEVFKPMTLARVSIRIFWSLVLYWDRDLLNTYSSSVVDKCWYWTRKRHSKHKVL